MTMGEFIAVVGTAYFATEDYSTPFLNEMFDKHWCIPEWIPDDIDPERWLPHIDCLAVSGPLTTLLNDISEKYVSS